MGRKDQRRSPKPGQTARNGVFQQIGALGAAIVKNIPALLVQNREMHMHPVARILGKGFCHKGRSHPMPTGHAAHQRFE